VAVEVGVNASTLERWPGDALDPPRRESKVWSAAARFDVLLTTAAMDDTGKGAWCRANGVLLLDPPLWRQTAAQSLGDPQDQRVSPSQTTQDRRRIKEPERDLRGQKGCDQRTMPIAQAPHTP